MKRHAGAPYRPWIGWISLPAESNLKSYGQIAQITSHQGPVPSLSRVPSRPHGRRALSLLVGPFPPSFSQSGLLSRVPARITLVDSPRFPRPLLAVWYIGKAVWYVNKAALSRYNITSLLYLVTGVF